MKICPECREGFEDDLVYCTFDGASLEHLPPGARVAGRLAVPQGWSLILGGAGSKKALIAFLALALVGGGTAAAYFILKRNSQTEVPRANPAAKAQEISAEQSATGEEAKPVLLISEVPRTQLIEMVPKNLTGRFHAGKPEEARVVKDESNEYVVLVGAGRAAERPADWVLVLQYQDQGFVDVTRRVLPAAFGGGAIAGQRAQAKFDTSTSNLIINVPASSSSIVKECASCEHAYQVVTLEWKDSRYREVSREWENDRYTAFYVVADALAKRQVDARARDRIDRSLEPVITEGFKRDVDEAWTVRAVVESDAAETGAYELINGDESLIITVSKINGQWKAVRIREG